MDRQTDVIIMTKADHTAWQIGYQTTFLYWGLNHNLDKSNSYQALVTCMFRVLRAIQGHDIDM